MRRAAFLLVVAILISPISIEAKIEVDPYGFVLVNASWNTRTQLDIPFLAPAEEPAVGAVVDGGEPNFIITPRQSRFGLKFKAPDARMTPSGAVEMDFWGLLGDIPFTAASQTAPRLRRAFFTLHFDQWELLAGQEWSVVSPLNPTTLMHQSVPQFSFAGNLWQRVPQVLARFDLVNSDRNALDFDFAFARPFGGDVVPNRVNVNPDTGVGVGGVGQLDEFGGGENSALPFLQSRFAFTAKGRSTVTLGVSGQLGWMDADPLDTNKDAITTTSYVIVGDLKLTAARKVTIQAEGYYGQNVRNLFGLGGFRTVVDTSGVVTDANEVKGGGGWGEIKLQFNEIWLATVGAGVMSNDDEFLGPGAVKANGSVVGNVIATVDQKLKVGIEVGYINTERIIDDNKNTDGGADNVNWNISALYPF